MLTYHHKKITSDFCRYSWADSACSASAGLTALGSLLAGAKTTHAVIGPAAVALAKSPVTCLRVRTWLRCLCADMHVDRCMLTHSVCHLQISWGCTGDSLSDTAAHPLFSRTVAPETMKSPAIIAVMKRYNWRRVALYVWRRGTCHGRVPLSLAFYF